MTHQEKGRKGGIASGLARRQKGREQLKGCKTLGDVLRVVQDLERKAWLCGYQSGRRRGVAVGYSKAIGEPVTR